MSRGRGDGCRQWRTGLQRTRGAAAGLSDRWGALERREHGKVARLVVLSTRIRNPGEAAVLGRS